MEANLIQLDVSTIKAEIEEIRSKMSALQSELDFRLHFIEYAKNMGIPVNAQARNSELGTDGGERHDKEDGLLEKGISEYILGLLNNEEMEPNKINELYAQATGKDFVLARNNVSNALNRLKKAGKINNKFREGTTKTVWFKM